MQLFVKILKAVKQKHNVDLDGEYRLPNILKNYKGNDVKPVNIPEYKTVVAPKLYFDINEEWNRNWGKYLPPGKNVVYTSEISKQNKVGITKVRQLVLSDVPSLIYIDATEGGGSVGSDGVKTGEVEWFSGSAPVAVAVSWM